MREFEQWRETFDTYVTELIGDIIEAADRVVVRQVWHGVGRGPEAHLESTVVFTLREGKISYAEFFWDHAEVLETLGLSRKASAQTRLERPWALSQCARRGSTRGRAVQPLVRRRNTASTAMPSEAKK